MEGRNRLHSYVMNPLSNKKIYKKGFNDSQPVHLIKLEEQKAIELKK